MNIATTNRRHRVAIIGGGLGGLGGLAAARRLRRADVEVTLVDRTNHHLFQPLLNQLATGLLSEGDIAPPLRELVPAQRNASVVFGEVVAIETNVRRVTVQTLDQTSEILYDSLIIAMQSCFGHSEFAVDERKGAGVKASPVGGVLADATGAQLDRAGRVKVEEDCSLPGYPEIFVVGDFMQLRNLPGVSQVAIQSGRHAADTISHRLKGDMSRRPLRYRLSVFFNWTVALLGGGRAERVITLQQVFGRHAVARAEPRKTPERRVSWSRPERNPS